MNFLDIATIVVLIINAKAGHKRGFITIVCDIIAFLGGVLLGLHYASDVGKMVEANTNLGPSVASLAGFAIIWIGIFLFVSTIGSMMNKVVKFSVLKPINRFGGMILGLVKGMLTVLPAIIVLVFVNAPLIDDSVLFKGSKKPLMALTNRFMKNSGDTVSPDQFENREQPPQSRADQVDEIMEKNDMDWEELLREFENQNP